MAKRRRTEIAFIADPAARLVTFSKRRKGLFNKASELCRLCDARAAVVVFSCAGKPYSFGDPSADDVISDYLRVSDGDGGVVVKPQMDLVQWEKWVDADLNACATEQELERFISKYEALRDGVRQKLRALEEEKSQVNVGGGGDSHALTEEEIDEIFNSLDRSPALPDLLADVDQDVVMISSENRAVGCGSSAVESNSARSDLEGCRTNAAGDGSLGAATIPTRSDLEDGEFDLVGLLTRLAAGGGFL